MIRVKVSAVFQVRDGFTGRAVEGSRLLCYLDGAVIRPEAKAGGYLILTNLEPGNHELTLRCLGFLDEVISFDVGASRWYEGYAALKPGAGYSFSGAVTRLNLSVATGQEQVWITTPCSVECKIAQTTAEAGAAEFRIYCKGKHTLLPVPGYFLIDDGANSEIVVLENLSDETGRTASPLTLAHSRSRRLLPVQRYRPDGEGRLCAVFSSPGNVIIWSGKGEPFAADLHEGENEVSII